MCMVMIMIKTTPYMTITSSQNSALIAILVASLLIVGYDVTASSNRDRRNTRLSGSQRRQSRAEMQHWDAAWQS